MLTCCQQYFKPYAAMTTLGRRGKEQGRALRTPAHRPARIGRLGKTRPRRNTGEKLRMAILMQRGVSQGRGLQRLLPHVVKGYLTNTREGRFILTHSSGNISPPWGWGRHRGCSTSLHGDGSMWLGLFASRQLRKQRAQATVGRRHLLQGLLKQLTFAS